MATRRTDLQRMNVYPPVDPPREKVVGSRLAHQHDMNDAVKAYIDGAEYIQGYVKSKEKKDEKKEHSKLGHFILLHLVLTPITFGVFYILFRKLFGLG